MQQTIERATRYGELKIQRCVQLTDTAVDVADVIAEKYKISRSEAIEQILRGKIQVTTEETTEKTTAETTEN